MRDIPNRTNLSVMARALGSANKFALCLGFAAGMAVAGPAAAALIFQTTVAPVHGFADFSNALPGVGSAASIWLTVDTGTIVQGSGFVDGEYGKLWWEFWGDTDADGNPVPVLWGNEYIFGESCDSLLTAQYCGPLHIKPPLKTVQTRLSHNVLRADYARPLEYNNCLPFNGVFYQNCAFFMLQFEASYGARVQSDVAVTFSVFDAPPPAGDVPEPAAWSLMIAGFGLTGLALRRRTRPEPART